MDWELQQLVRNRAWVNNMTFYLKRKALAAHELASPRIKLVE